MRIFLTFYLLFQLFTIASTARAETGEKVSERDIFSVNGGLRLGCAFQEQSPNNRIFDPGFVVGPDISLYFLHFHRFRVGIAGGYLFFARKRTKGTDALQVSTQYNRFDLSAALEIFLKAVVFNARVGAGFTVFSTRTDFDNGDNLIFRDNSGAQAGFLGGLGIGAEVGNHWWKINRKVILSAQSDWLRRGNRDEFTLLFLASIELYAKKSRI